MIRTKKDLRAKYIKTRLELSSLDWQNKSHKICDYLAIYLSDNNCKTILSYFSFKQEPDLDYLHQNSNFIWGFPRCVELNLQWHQWRWGDDLIKGKYKILEPSPLNSPINLDLVDLILVPSVGCDRTGYRLGYGGGFYDRTFAKSEWEKIPKMGILYDFAYGEEFIRDLWDKPLDSICTESGIKIFRNKNING